jgi:septal ring factor EnvC (AmiA/AmiB activator)
VDRLRRDNGLTDDTIQPGQRIELTAALRDAGLPQWQPPYRGHATVVSDFGPYEQDRIILPRTGVAVALSVGSEVLAPATGVVRYLAPMAGLGTVLILEHARDHHTVLRPLDASGVPWQPDECVIVGDVLGHVAAPPDGPLEPYLHVELRVGSKAVAPDPLLR